MLLTGTYDENVMTFLSGTLENFACTLHPNHKKCKFVT